MPKEKGGRQRKKPPKHTSSCFFSCSFLGFHRLFLQSLVFFISSNRVGGDSMKKKSLLLRIDPKLHEALRKWAEDDFRSINAQIEFLLQKSLEENRRGDAS